MCFFGGGSKAPPPVQQPTLAIPQTAPIQNQTPKTSSGADLANAASAAASQQAMARKSVFQIDLTKNTGANTGNQTGASSN
jgi:hypothetical protein